MQFPRQPCGDVFAVCWLISESGAQQRFVHSLLAENIVPPNVLSH